MNIVHIEDFFHPDAGYQINILPKYMVKQGHKVTVVTSEMDKIPDNIGAFFKKENINASDYVYSEKTGVDIVRVPIKKFVSGRAVFDKKLFNVVESLKPDIIYIHGNDTLTAITFLLKIKRVGCPLVMDSHMLEMASLNRFSKLFRLIYKKIFTPKIIKNKIPVIRTQDDPYVEKFLGIPLEQCPWISVGSDTLLFHPDGKVKAQFRRELKISSDDFVVIYTGKLDESKGGKLLAEAFEKKLKTSKNVVLIVVGSSVGEYGQEVEKIFKRSEIRIIRFPTQKYIDLAKFYQSADLCVFPKQCSLSFYDAQACGLPVISENNNINIDRLKNNNGFTFKADDIKDFRNKISSCVNMSKREFDQIAANAYNFVNENYDYELIAEKYTNVLEKQLDRYNLR